MFTQIRETSIAVANLDAAVAAFEEKLGLQPSSTNVDPRPPVESRAAMYRIGDSSLALMESTSEPMLFEDFPAFDQSYSKVRMNFTRPSSLHGVLIEVQELTP
jgi:catechol 2,3-dioxygenase-like lactoylglutathione lyase family enzyme